MASKPTFQRNKFGVQADHLKLLQGSRGGIPASFWKKPYYHASSTGILSASRNQPTKAIVVLFHILSPFTASLGRKHLTRYFCHLIPIWVVMIKYECLHSTSSPKTYYRTASSRRRNFRRTSSPPLTRRPASQCEKKRNKQPLSLERREKGRGKAKGS